MVTTTSENGTSGTTATSASNNDPLETAQWTNYLPEAFGLREAVRNSSYRWCAREGAMWGVASATAMSLHRLRMGSKLPTVVNAFFGTSLIVMMPSYYFCYKRREHKENVIEMMMKYNQFGHATEMDPEPPIEEHPFWEQSTSAVEYGLDGGEGNRIRHDREFRGMMKERKHWQKPQKEQSLDDIFQEKR